METPAANKIGALFTANLKTEPMPRPILQRKLQLRAAGSPVVEAAAQVIPAAAPVARSVTPPRGADPFGHVHSGFETVSSQVSIEAAVAAVGAGTGGTGGTAGTGAGATVATEAPAGQRPPGGTSTGVAGAGAGAAATGVAGGAGGAAGAGLGAGAAANGQEHLSEVGLYVKPPLWQRVERAASTKRKRRCN